MLRRGNASETLEQIVTETSARAVFWNRRYDAPGRAIDTSIKESLKERGVAVESFNGSLLTEPWTQKTGNGGYYKVFTPYWKSVRSTYQPPEPAASPRSFATQRIESDCLSDWKLHPTDPDWSTGFNPHWRPGEAGAKARLSDFLNRPVNSYKQNRNRPDIEHGTSGLSPHLAFGEIGPAQIWRSVQHGIGAGTIDAANADTFLSEIGWREFSYVLLFHNPDLAHKNFKPDFDRMPWRDDHAALKAWQRGQTGYPIVDAGMRQLWQTGWMHNRVRMITASFLTKHLLIHWRHGEDWFWDCLVDADPASNSASWQWVAGSGADAAPYFRIFNPITQGEKFDETGNYVRHYCPELAGLPDKFLFSPWEADTKTLRNANVRLGETYPKPIIDHKSARQRALDAYETLKSSRDET